MYKEILDNDMKQFKKVLNESDLGRLNKILTSSFGYCMQLTEEELKDNYQFLKKVVADHRSDLDKSVRQGAIMNMQGNLMYCIKNKEHIRMEREVNEILDNN